MQAHVLRRLVGMTFALVAVSVLIFFLLQYAPGDAADTLVGDSASQTQLDRLRRDMGLDLPITTRYIQFMTRLITQRDMGRSLITNQEVSSLVLERLPFTLLLATTSMLLALILGIGIGVYAAVHSDSIVDTIVMGVTSLGIALPSFWTAMLLILLFSLNLGWLPVVGAGSLKHIILPAITLALPTTTLIARIFRSSLLEEMSLQYVLTAHAKGLASRSVLLRHVFRNSLIPLVTLLGLQFGHLLGGTFIVETIFGWPGLGRLTVQAIFDRDVPLVLGTSLTVAALFLAVNFIVDLIHAWLDPRVVGDTL